MSKVTVKWTGEQKEIPEYGLKKAGDTFPMEKDVAQTLSDRGLLMIVKSSKKVAAISSKEETKQ